MPGFIVELDLQMKDLQVPCSLNLRRFVVDISRAMCPIPLQFIPHDIYQNHPEQHSVILNCSLFLALEDIINSDVDLRIVETPMIVWIIAELRH
ncbi:hypothetical protein Tco_0051720 [Tanacetum coccineum]